MNRRDPYTRFEMIPMMILAAMALATAFASLFCKTSRTAGNAGWSDAVRFWAILGFLGGLFIAGVVVWSTLSARPKYGAALALIGFLWIAREAANYRDHLERTIIDHPYYTEQHLARGLQIVPMLAGMGVVTAFLIIVSEWMFPRSRRRRRSTRTATASGI